MSELWRETESSSRSEFLQNLARTRETHWRLDNILHFVSEIIDTKKYKLYLDLEGLKASTTSKIPARYMIISERPDIVITDKNINKIFIFELTVPFETNIEKENQYKHHRYGRFL